MGIGRATYLQPHFVQNSGCGIQAAGSRASPRCSTLDVGLGGLDKERMNERKKEGKKQEMDGGYARLRARGRLTDCLFGNFYLRQPYAVNLKDTELRQDKTKRGRGRGLTCLMDGSGDTEWR